MPKRLISLCIIWAAVLCVVPGRAAEPLILDLTWQASSSGCSLSIRPDIEAPFSVEPDFGMREVVRGLLPCAQSEDEQIAFVWDFDEERLYLDHNRNRDLTDDPEGIHSSSARDPRYQSFRDIKILIPRGTQVHEYRLNIDFNRYDPSRVYCHVFVRSGFEAEIELGGQQYRFQLGDNLDGQLGQGDGLHIASIKPGPFVPTAHLAMPERLFLGGCLYHCTYAWMTDDDRPKVRLTLTEQETTLGQLKIEGQDIEYLELQAQHVVPIFEPNQTTLPVPVGDYQCTALNLKRQGHQQMYVQSLDQRVTVDADQPATFRIGGPLKTLLTAERVNKYLRLNVKTVGQGGEEYQGGGASGPAPQFTVFKGDREVASGRFEYG